MSSRAPAGLKIEAGLEGLSAWLRKLGAQRCAEAGANIS
jgi:hypothetical protein